MGIPNGGGDPTPHRPPTKLGLWCSGPITDPIQKYFPFKHEKSKMSSFAGCSLTSRGVHGRPMSPSKKGVCSGTGHSRTAAPADSIGSEPRAVGCLGRGHGRGGETDAETTAGERGRRGLQKESKRHRTLRSTLRVRLVLPLGIGQGAELQINNYI